MPSSELIDDQDFQVIADVARSTFGLKLDPTKKIMVYRRLNSRVQDLQLDGFGAYAKVLQDDPEEKLTLLSALTTNLTSFFRERHHFDLMRSEHMPKLIEKAKAGKRVRLWSCACSSGEEPYSLAMEVLEAFPDAGKYDLRILATDIDPDILEKAKAGIYTEEQLDGLDPALRQKYLTRQAGSDDYGMVVQARNLISFGQLNLPHAWPFQGSFDVIFCRNVAIYFDQETQDTLWKRLSEHLNPGGLLCIGHSERLGGPGQKLVKALGKTAYLRLG